jgi:2-haloacid dehalogenase
MNPKAVVFDAYGTLFDVHSVAQAIGGDFAAGRTQALSALWRQKQLEYTWLRSLMGRYEDFWEITHAALLAAARQLRIEASSAQLRTLMQAYLVPAAFSDVRPAMERLQGKPLAILSNGSPSMLESAVRHNGLESCFADVISVDRVKIYKPSPRVYALGPEILQRPRKRSCSSRQTRGMPPEQRRLATRCAGATGPPRKWSRWASLPISRCPAWTKLRSLLAIMGDETEMVSPHWINGDAARNRRAASASYRERTRAAH